jgi:hypothetical protein
MALACVQLIDLAYNLASTQRGSRVIVFKVCELSLHALHVLL